MRQGTLCELGGVHSAASEAFVDGKTIKQSKCWVGGVHQCTPGSRPVSVKD